MFMKFVNEIIIDYYKSIINVALRLVTLNTVVPFRSSTQHRIRSRHGLEQHETRCFWLAKYKNRKLQEAIEIFQNNNNCNRDVGFE